MNTFTMFNCGERFILNVFRDLSDYKTRKENFKPCPDGVIDCHPNENGIYEQVGDRK